MMKIVELVLVGLGATGILMLAELAKKTYETMIK